MNKIQKDLLEVLKVFNKVCKKNDIKYSLAFGNLLGAVRHKGFIPWDDDMDLFMDIDNYNKLIKAQISFENEGIYFIRFTEGGLFNQLLLKIESLDKDIQFDLFVLRDLSSKKFNKNVQLFLSYLFVVFEYIQDTDFQRKKSSKLKKIIYSIIQIVQAVFRFVNLSKFTYKIYIRLYNFMMSGYKIFILLGNRVTFLTFSRLDVYPIIDIPYEDSTFPIMNDPKVFLKKQYGDYMKLPEKEKRRPHHK